MAESKEALRDRGAHAGPGGIPAAAQVLTPQQLPQGATVRAEQEHPHAVLGPTAQDAVLV